MAKETKTGECFYRDPDGTLWRADSYVDAKGYVTTQSVEIEKAPPAQEPDNGDVSAVSALDLDTVTSQASLDALLAAEVA